MLDSYKYFVVKDRNDLSITSFEFDKVEGYDLNPRKVKIKDGIDVSKMIVINPLLIETLASKKVSIKFNKLVNLLMYVLSPDNDDETGETYREALNEISKLRLEIYTKYKNKLKNEELDIYNRKLNILEQELRSRLYYLEDIYSYDSQMTEGKSR